MNKSKNNESCNNNQINSNDVENCELWYNSGKDYHKEESLNGTESLCDICHRKVSFTKESTFSKSVSQPVHQSEITLSVSAL